MNTINKTLQIPRQNGVVISENGTTGHPEIIQPERFDLTIKGLQECIRNKGSIVALKNYLILLKEGQWISNRKNDVERERLRNKIAEEILIDESEAIDLQSKVNKMVNNDIPVATEEVQTLIQQRDELDSDRIKKAFAASFRPVLAWLMVALSIGLGLFLWLFYASAADTAFFRNLGDEVLNAGGLDDLGNLMNGFFNAESAFTWQAHSPFLFLFVCIFFVLGLIPHMFFEKEIKPTWFKWVIIVFFGLIPLFADVLLAYKIEVGMAEMSEILSGATSEGHFGINFWLVIVMGYLAYMAWGFFIFFTIEEFQKKDPASLIQAQMKLVDKGILRAKEVLKETKDRYASLLQELESKQQNIKLKRSSLDSQFTVSVDELLRNIAEFFNGWLSGLSQSDLTALEFEAGQVVDEFRNQLSGNYMKAAS
jgi:hypothetical protein